MSWLSHCDSTITPPKYYYVSFTSCCLLAGNPHSSAATFRTHWSLFIWKRLSSVHRCPTVLPIKPNSSGIKNGQSWSKGQPLPWPRSPPPLLLLLLRGGHGSPASILRLCRGGPGRLRPLAHREGAGVPFQGLVPGLHSVQAQPERAGVFQGRAQPLAFQRGACRGIHGSSLPG